MRSTHMFNGFGGSSSQFGRAKYGKKVEESRDELMKRAKREREERQRLKFETKNAIVLQKYVRLFVTNIRQCRLFEQQWVEVYGHQGQHVNRSSLQLSCDCLPVLLYSIKRHKKFDQDSITKVVNVAKALADAPSDSGSFFSSISNQEQLTKAILRARKLLYIFISCIEKLVQAQTISSSSDDSIYTLSQACQVLINPVSWSSSPTQPCSQPPPHVRVCSLAIVHGQYAHISALCAWLCSQFHQQNNASASGTVDDPMVIDDNVATDRHPAHQCISELVVSMIRAYTSATIALRAGYGGELSSDAYQPGAWKVLLVQDVLSCVWGIKGVCVQLLDVVLEELQSFHTMQALINTLTAYVPQPAQQATGSGAKQRIMVQRLSSLYVLISNILVNLAQLVVNAHDNTAMHDMVQPLAQNSGVGQLGSNGDTCSTPSSIVMTRFCVVTHNLWCLRHSLAVALEQQLLGEGHGQSLRDVWQVNTSLRDMWEAAQHVLPTNEKVDLESQVAFVVVNDAGHVSLGMSTIKVDVESGLGAYCVHDGGQQGKGKRLAMQPQDVIDATKNTLDFIQPLPHSLSNSFTAALAERVVLSAKNLLTHSSALVTHATPTTPPPDTPTTPPHPSTTTANDSYAGSWVNNSPYPRSFPPLAALDQTQLSRTAAQSLTCLVYLLLRMPWTHQFDPKTSQLLVRFAVAPWLTPVLWYTCLRHIIPSTITPRHTKDPLLQQTLDVFCTFYAVRLSGYTSDSLDRSTIASFPPTELCTPSARAGLIPLLRTILVTCLWQPDTDTSSPRPATSSSTQRTVSMYWSAGALLMQLYTRNERRGFCEQTAFHSRTSPSDAFRNALSAAMTSDQLHAITSLQLTSPLISKVSAHPLPPEITALEGKPAHAILALAPCLLRFEDRARLLQRVLDADRSQQGDVVFEEERPRGEGEDDELFQYMNMFRRSAFVKIRRTHIVEDGFDSLQGLGSNIKGHFQIRFIDQHGRAEAGIDGGGLFKDFMEQLLISAFNVDFGLFSITSDKRLYPNPHAHYLQPQAHKFMKFLGLMVGKAVYEGVLVNLPLAPFFLKKFLGTKVDLYDLRLFDSDLHANLTKLFDVSEQEFKDLDLTFSVSEDDGLGQVKEVAFFPGGEQEPVTRTLLQLYLYHYTEYKLNRQIGQGVNAFLDGFFQVMERSWIRLFSENEIQMLISGSEAGLDMADMREHTAYTGGYSASHPVIKQFWDVVNAMDHEDQRSLLKFITGCSRAPLLGFKQLQPPLTITRTRDVVVVNGEQMPNQVRLPSASTCVNLLKLPPYQSATVMQKKLTQALSAATTFELS